MARLNDVEPPDEVGARLAAFLRTRRRDITRLVDRADLLAETHRGGSREFVLYHADTHAAKVLIDTEGILYVVDWDTLMRVPKERDLMFIGAGKGVRGRTIARSRGCTRATAGRRSIGRHSSIAAVSDWWKTLLRTAHDLLRRVKVVPTEIWVFANSWMRFALGDVVEIAMRTDKRP